MPKTVVITQVGDVAIEILAVVMIVANTAVVCSQVLTNSFEGDYSENPLFFRHFNLEFINLRVNGTRIPSEPLKPDFDEEAPLIAREFYHLFLNTGAIRMDRGNLVGFTAFQSGSCIFPFVSIIHV
ncbi:MAG: hypothetical protein MI867_07575 [Pseudomonadales bacterium]|nr:hypothetical protein [Pseudomonadales bacterium]